MFSITTTLTGDDIKPAVQLAKDNYIDLIHKHLEVDGPTSDMCQTQVEVEVRTYLTEAIAQHYGLRMTVVLAKDEAQGTVIGFAIALAGQLQTDCGLNYAVVHQDYRRQGVLRAMLDEIKARYQFIGLNSKIDKVPYYESLGFRITGPETTQVAMSWGLNKPHAEMLALDFSGVEEIRSKVDAFERYHGPNSRQIWVKLNDMQNEQERKVLDYVSKRASGLSHAQSF